MLAEHKGGLTPMAGATDLLVHWPSRQEDHDRTFLDLSGVGELRSIAWTPTALRIGALATYWETIREGRIGGMFPVLIEAARQVGAIQIQSRGTWAGNIVNASPAADGVPALMCYDANVVLASSASTRTVPLAEFYLGYRKTVRRPEELVSAIEIPLKPYDFGVFHKVGPRRAQAITKVGVAITRLAGVKADAWRVVANSVAPTVCRCRNVERAIGGGTFLRSPDDFMPFVSADVSPIDDIRSTADYRRTVLCRLLYHSLKGHCPAVV